MLVQDAEQLAKLDDYRARNPRLEHVLTFDDLDDLRARGRDYALAYPGELERVVAAVSPDDVFTYIYTSGTTGPPKACMILHRNYYAMAAVVDEIDDFTMADDTMLLYLPLAHNFGRLMHLQGPYVGFTLAFLADPLRAGEALKAVQPTLFPSVPRVFEKVHTAVLAKFDDETGAKRKIVDWALGVGRKASERRSAGKALGPVLGAQHRLADKLVYSKVKAQLGGNFRIGISGGAPLSKEIAEFFHSLDILILEGYGLTECTTAATVNRPSRFRFGTVGPALPGTELRIAEDGEVLISSPTVFAGYYKDEEATREVLGPDGWLRSGDIGDLDADGFLTITDRKKDIIVTAGGKNVAPQNLENELKASKFVSQALVVGDKRPYCIALITLDEPELVKWAQARGLKGELSLAALAGNADVRELVDGIVERMNADHSRYEQIKKFTILPRDFTMADDELTATLKLKRRVCQEHFAQEDRRSWPRGSARRLRDCGDGGAQHGGLGFGLRDSAALDFMAGGVDDRPDHREEPGDGEIAPEDALLLAALDQRLELVEHGDVAAVELLRREPCRVEREESVEVGELPPGGSEHSLQRLHRLAALGLGASHRLGDLCDRVLHDGVEKSRARRKVDVDGRSDHAGAASDLRHAAVGIARQCFEGGVEDGGHAAIGVCPASFRGGRLGRCRRFCHR